MKKEKIKNVGISGEVVKKFIDKKSFYFILGILFSLVVCIFILVFSKDNNVIENNKEEIKDNVIENNKEEIKDSDTSCTIIDISYDNPILDDTYELFSSKITTDFEWTLNYPRIETIMNENLTAEQKNYVAFSNYLKDKADLKECSEYKYADNTSFGCAWVYEHEYPISEGYTYVVKEEDMKKYVEKIFGVGTYKSATFDYGLACRFYYANGEYFEQCTNGGGTAGTYSQKFLKAYKIGNLLIIETLVEPMYDFEVDKYFYTYKFELVEGNYIFHLLNKELINS